MFSSRSSYPLLSTTLPKSLCASQCAVRSSAEQVYSFFLVFHRYSWPWSASDAQQRAQCQVVSKLCPHMTMSLPCSSVQRPSRTSSELICGFKRRTGALSTAMRDDLKRYIAIGWYSTLGSPLWHSLDPASPSIVPYVALTSSIVRCAL